MGTTLYILCDHYASTSPIKDILVSVSRSIEARMIDNVNDYTIQRTPVGEEDPEYFFVRITTKDVFEDMLKNDPVIVHGKPYGILIRVIQGSDFDMPIYYDFIRYLFEVLPDMALLNTDDDKYRYSPDYIRKYKDGDDVMWMCKIPNN